MGQLVPSAGLVPDEPLLRRAESPRTRPMTSTARTAGYVPECPVKWEGSEGTLASALCPGRAPSWGRWGRRRRRQPRSASRELSPFWRTPTLDVHRGTGTVAMSTSLPPTPRFGIPASKSPGDASFGSRQGTATFLRPSRARSPSIRDGHSESGCQHSVGERSRNTEQRVCCFSVSISEFRPCQFRSPPIGCPIACRAIPRAMG